MTKKRILIANDAHWLGTGYGVYGKELLTRLYNTGKYEIAELACYASEETARKNSEHSKWRVYSNVPDQKNKEEYQNYSSSTVNAFGLWRFENVLIDFQPDVVFDMRDYWMYSFQETSPLRQFYRWVVMPTVDSAPQNPDWLNTFANFDVTIPYTEWAKKTLKEQCGNRINLFPDIANAGVNLEEFVPAANKQKAVKEIFGEDLIITGCVMRNQKRKLFPNVLMVYKKYLDQLLEKGNTELYNKSYLYLHTSYPESNGWNLPSLLLEHDLLDKTFITSICVNCRAVYPTKFHENVSICEICNKPSCMITSTQNAVPTHSLVKIYQTFDLFLQVAICEGFGMPQIEAAACGVPIASVDYSAMSEIVKKLEGYPIPAKCLFRELETGADRAQPDNEALLSILHHHHSLSEEEKEIMGNKTRKLCEKYYSWDLVADVWDRAINSVDLSKNIPWDAPEREIDLSQVVPGKLSPANFVKFIVVNIIKEPELLKTSFIIRLIKDLSNGYRIESSGIKKLNHRDVVNDLQNYAQRKKTIENKRINREQLVKEL